MLMHSGVMCNSNGSLDSFRRGDEMTDSFCTTFTCRQRHSCKRGLPIEELQGTKAYVRTDSFCTGYIPIREECIQPVSWLDRLFEINWRFC